MIIPKVEEIRKRKEERTPQRRGAEVAERTKEVY